MPKQISEIREACVKANPCFLGIDSVCDICHKNYCECPERLANGDWTKEGRPIRLADVLAAIEEAAKEGGHKGYTNEQRRWFEDSAVLLLREYNLLQDDLTLQSPECIQFIHNLIHR